MERQENESTPQGDQAKKEYSSPKLTIYGDIRTLTQAVGMNGMLDGGGIGMRRSQP
jgi:hypothetical protein